MLSNRFGKRRLSSRKKTEVSAASPSERLLERLVRQGASDAVIERLLPGAVGNGRVAKLRSSHRGLKGAIHLGWSKDDGASKK